MSHLAYQNDYIAKIVIGIGGAMAAGEPSIYSPCIQNRALTHEKCHVDKNKNKIYKF
jgi:hypothetical protein